MLNNFVILTSNTKTRKTLFKPFQQLMPHLFTTNTTKFFMPLKLVFVRPRFYDIDTINFNDKLPQILHVVQLENDYLILGVS